MSLQTEPWGIVTGEPWMIEPLDDVRYPDDLDECAKCFTSWDATYQPTCPVCGPEEETA